MYYLLSCPENPCRPFSLKSIYTHTHTLASTKTGSVFRRWSEMRTRTEPQPSEPMLINFPCEVEKGGGRPVGKPTCGCLKTDKFEFEATAAMHGGRKWPEGKSSKRVSTFCPPEREHVHITHHTIAKFYLWTNKNKHCKYVSSPPVQSSFPHHRTSESTPPTGCKLLGRGIYPVSHLGPLCAMTYRCLGCNFMCENEQKAGLIGTLLGTSPRRSRQMPQVIPCKTMLCSSIVEPLDM